jgi:hypothetical protein
MLFFELVRGSSHRPPERCVIAAGPMTKQPCTMVYRWVVVAWGDDMESASYSVHREVFAEECELDGKWRSSLSDGTYFGPGPDRLVRAAAKFGERVAGGGA